MEVVMRRFKFRFETVLKHRTILEEMRMQAFAIVQQEMVTVDARLAASRAEYARTVAGRPSSLDVEDIARRERYLDTLSARLAQEERVREGIAARLEDARVALLEARQACKALERVREQDLQEYMRLTAQAEQTAMDEMATQR